MLNFSGFYGPTASKSPMPEPTQLIKKNITLQNPKDGVKLEKGVIKFKNGKRLFDDEAEIFYVFYIKNQLFYMIELQDGFKIKNINKETIWEVNARYIQYSKYHDDLMLYIYNDARSADAYKFDGKKITLVDRDLDIAGGKLYGIYLLKVSSEKAFQMVYFDGFKQIDITDITITNVLDGSKIKYNDFYKFLNSYCIGCISILGIADDNLILAYDEGFQKAIASFNLRTKKGDVLHLETPNEKSNTSNFKK